MKPITIGELFTEEQLRQAAKVFSHTPDSNGFDLHQRLHNVLEPDKARFDKLEVDLNYAAYLLEAHRNIILNAYL